MDTANTGTANDRDDVIRQQQQQRGNISYFLFLSMMFFFMSNSGPDMSAESRYASALKRLTRERDAFKEWLYPGSVVHEPIKNGTAIATSTSLLDEPLASTMTTVPVQQPTSRRNGTAGDGQEVDDGTEREDRQEGEDEDANSPQGPFILPDLTPPASLADRVHRLMDDPATAIPALYYHNISGWLKGSWQSHASVDVTDGKVNGTLAKEYRGTFPWDGRTRRTQGGKIVRLNVREAAPHEKGRSQEEENDEADIVLIRGSMVLALHDMAPKEGDADSEDDEGRTTELELEGVHFKRNGSFFLHAAPEHIDLDMRELPGLLFTNQTRNATAQTILKELDARLERIRRALATGIYPDATSDVTDDSSLNCTFAMYGHLRPLPPHVSPARLREYEAEMRKPRGVSTVKLPPPSMDAIMFSPECNLVLELDDMQGLELDRFWNKALNYSLILAIVTAIQAWVLVKQMEYTSTPTAIGRVAHLTIAMQVVIDVYFCVTHLTLGVVTYNQASLAFLMPGFFGILSGLLFGLRYAAIIRASTYRPESPPAPPAPLPAPSPAQATPATLRPTAASAPTGRRSTELPNTSTPLLSRGSSNATVEDGESAYGQMKAAITFALAALSIVLAFAFLGWFPILMTLIYSFWVPQIYQNAERGSGRHPLLKQYYMCTALTRIFIPLYVWACPDNLLFSDTSPWVWALVAYQLFQVLILYLQDKLGPRFFLPRGVFFQELDTWDYHPLLPPADIESGGDDTKTGNEVDCVICFEKIELAAPGRTSLDMRTAEKDSNGGPGVFDGVRRGANRMSYMVPPCHHIAHTSCLESWAAIKMECPLCRRPLPPF